LQVSGNSGSRIHGFASELKQRKYCEACGIPLNAFVQGRATTAGAQGALSARQQSQALSHGLRHELPGSGPSSHPRARSSSEIQRTKQAADTSEAMRRDSRSSEVARPWESRNVFCSLRQICDCPIKTDLRQSDLQLIVTGAASPGPGETLATEDDSPTLRREQAGSERENSRLASAPWPNEYDLLARATRSEISTGPFSPGNIKTTSSSSRPPREFASLYLAGLSIVAL
jgi:hypothetical protein